MSVLGSEFTPTSLSKKHQKQVLLALNEAILFYGKQASLARSLKISTELISSWKSFKNPVPAKTAAKIETLTSGAIKKERFRPLDWHIYWPPTSTMAEISSHDSLFNNQTTPK